MIARAALFLVVCIAAPAGVMGDVGEIGAGEATSAPASAAPEATEAVEALARVEESVGPSGTIKAFLAVTLLAVAPALAILVTCFTRIIVVLGLLRHALGTQQLPPNQVLFGLALFMTLVVMAPVLREVHSEAAEPYAAGQMSPLEAWHAGKAPLREFMIRQIEACGNSEDVYLFLDDEVASRESLTWEDVGTEALVPGFVISELKTAFLIGFRIYLPFLVVDLLVATSLLSMGMLMLPPTLVSLPFKLLLFVLADGWSLVVGTLMESFG
jgi:flagellar biosynthesis protein FliP